LLFSIDCVVAWVSFPCYTGMLAKSNVFISVRKVKGMNDMYLLLELYYVQCAMSTQMLYECNMLVLLVMCNVYSNVMRM